MCGIKKRTKKSLEIKQVSTKGSEATQIGNQTINVGMSPQAASEMALSLFMENFPKLQEEAGRIARERADKLLGQVISKLENEGVNDYSSFKDPDVQYVLLEAQKKYARFGTTEMLGILSGLICKRIKDDKDLTFKVTIDKAIEIAPIITPQQLDYLSLLFFCKRVVYQDIRTLSELGDRYNIIAKQYKEADFNSLEYLLMLGCLDINLSSVAENYTEQIGLSEKEIESVCPEIVKQVRGDYGPSSVGILLAIMNAETKYNYKLDPHIWIR